MKSVKINIKKLGAIRDSELYIKPLMIFSGESGLGKSYAAFLVHYFYVILLTQRLNLGCNGTWLLFHTSPRQGAFPQGEGAAVSAG